MRKYDHDSPLLKTIACDCLSLRNDPQCQQLRFCHVFTRQGRALVDLIWRGHVLIKHGFRERDQSWMGL
jgi:hypothetical protein